MTLAEIRDWLLSLEAADSATIGRLDGSAEKTLAVLDRGGRGAPVTALGGLQCSSYGVKDVSLLLRWNRNANETERAAARLWDAVRGAAHVDLPGGGHIQFIRPLVPGPVPLNADESGVYEYRIEISIYYRR